MQPDLFWLWMCPWIYLLMEAWEALKTMQHPINVSLPSRICQGPDFTPITSEIRLTFSDHLLSCQSPPACHHLCMPLIELNWFNGSLNYSKGLTKSSGKILSDDKFKIAQRLQSNCWMSEHLSLKSDDLKPKQEDLILIPLGIENSNSGYKISLHEMAHFLQ